MTRDDPTDAARRQRKCRERRRAGRRLVTLEVPVDFCEAACLAGLIDSADLADQDRLRARLGEALDALVTELL